MCVCVMLGVYVGVLVLKMFLSMTKIKRKTAVRFIKTLWGVTEQMGNDAKGPACHAATHTHVCRRVRRIVCAHSG
jgi:hypothetical protein